MLPAGPLLLLALAGCGAPDCEGSEQVVVERDGHALDCGELDTTRRWVETLAARPLSATRQRRLARAMKRALRQDPAGLDQALEQVAAQLEELSGATGLEAAELRSRAAWTQVRGPGVIGHEDVASIVSHAVGAWEGDPGEQLVLTEMDIEGWVLYGSLCREVQGAGVLRISVSDRVEIYRQVRRHWRAADRDGKVAMAAVGPFWDHVRRAWAASSYSRQQAWIAAAPLPPPMTATSLGYLSTLLDSDLERHARVLHGHLGPLHLDVPE